MNRRLQVIGLSLGLALSLTAGPQAKCGNGQFHGFWVFGSNKVYLSHKPLASGTCHNHQVLLEVKFKNPGDLAKYQQARSKGQVSFKASKIQELKTLAQVNSSVEGTLFQGNFEDTQGRFFTKIAPCTVVVQKQLLLSDPLVTAAKAGHLRGYLIGEGKERYLINRIDQRDTKEDKVAQDLDQALKITPSDASNWPDSSTKALEVDLKGRQFKALQKPAGMLKAPGKSAFQVQDGPKVPFQVEKLVFQTSSDDGFLDNFPLTP